MLEKNIISTINLAHNYGSAFSQDQLHTYLRCKISRPVFDKQLSILIEREEIFDRDGFLFTREISTDCLQKQEWSRRIFSRYRLHLIVLSKLPWIKFIGLTGANAFESCRIQDDVDMFIITENHRLWISYACIVVLSILFRKRRTLCVNYLVDENNLKIRKQTYFTAIQLVQMIPVYNVRYKHNLINANHWIRHQLPNLIGALRLNEFYDINLNYRRKISFWPELLKKVNQLIYKKYCRHISEKFPRYVGSSMIIEEGLAKLHHEDHHDVYDRLNGVMEE